jgi:transcriptional regulator with XRE-family HTH domain
VYRERDYAFAQLVLTLRTAIGLSQVGLAERLGASRRAVADWEGGLSYPKAERLKQLITLGMHQQAFAAGCEEEEIRALWKAAHQKVLLDDAWLHDLLAPLSPVPLSPRAWLKKNPSTYRRACGMRKPVESRSRPNLHGRAGRHDESEAGNPTCEGWNPITLPVIGRRSLFAIEKQREVWQWNLAPACKARFSVNRTLPS